MDVDDIVDGMVPWKDHGMVQETRFSTSMFVGGSTSSNPPPRPYQNVRGKPSSTVYVVYT